MTGVGTTGALILPTLSFNNRSTTMLMFSNEDNVVTRQDLSKFDDATLAMHTRSHKPVPFSQGIDLVQDVAEAAGFRFGEEQYVLARNDTQLFGLIEVTNFSTEDSKICFGVRSSTNKSLSWQLCGGESLSICTNLDLFGSVVLKRKQTTFVMNELRNLVDRFMFQFTRSVEDRAAQVARYKAAQLQDSTANHTIIQMLRTGIINTQRVEKVVNEYYEPTHAEHLNENGERTNWTLFNAATEAFKGSPISTYTERSQKLHDLIGKATDYALAA
jgi:hypothetical protein